MPTPKSGATHFVSRTASLRGFVIERDSEDKEPTETDIVAHVESRSYRGFYEVLRDLALRKERVQANGREHSGGRRN